MSFRTPEQLATALSLTDKTIEERLAAIKLTTKDLVGIRDAWEHVEPYFDHFIHDLYDRFRQVPELNELLVHEARMARLIDHQKNYLRNVFCGEIDRAYILRRMAIGLVHHRIRVTPQWYLAACAHFVCDHVDVLLTTAKDQEQGKNRILTLLKRILFDASLVLDAYGRCEATSVCERRQQVGPSDDASATRVEATAASPPALTSDLREMSRIRLSKDAAAVRAAFIGLDQDDNQLLRSLQEVFAESLPAVLEDFYAFFTESPTLAELVPQEHVGRLIQLLDSYWQEFTDGRFDRAYALSRMRIGVIHEQIGLEPQSYLVGVARQAVGLLSSIPDSRERYAQLVKAFIRGLFFDVTFVVDAYMEARAETLLHADGYATQLMSGLSSAVAVVDAHGRILFANEQLISMVGIEAGILYMMPVMDAVPIAKGHDVIRHVLETGISRATDLVPWGTSSFRITVMKLEEQGDRSQRSFAILFDDVSSLVQLADGMEQDGIQYKTLANSISAVLWEMDIADKTIITISRPAFELTGYRDVSFLGRAGAWQDCIDEEDRERFQACCESLPVGGNRTCEYRLHLPNGDRIWVRTYLNRGSGTRSSVIGGVTVDITESRMAEELRMTAVGQVAGSVAHLVNNALTAMLCNMELQAAELGDARHTPFLQKAIEAGKRAVAVGSQLQAFSGGQLLQPQPQSLNKILHKSLPGLKNILGHNGDIDAQTSPNLWLCRVDSERFVNALRHLCLNAKRAISVRKSVQGLGKVRIVTRNVDKDSMSFEDPGFNQEWVELTVADNGCGMTEHECKRAAEPFFTTHASAESPGLGLSFVYGYVSQSGGHMLLKSALDEGTEVVLRFPRLAENIVSPTIDSSDLDNMTVLVVDDHEGVLESVAALVQQMGYEVRTAENAAEALALSEQADVDVLLTDVVLGNGGDGRELAHRMVKRQPRLSVILMSGYVGSIRDVPDAWSTLQKPIVLKQLVEHLKSAEEARLL